MNGKNVFDGIPKWIRFCCTAFATGLIMSVIYSSVLDDKEYMDRRFYNQMYTSAEELGYTEFMDLVKAGDILCIYYNTGKEKMVAVDMSAKDIEGYPTTEMCNVVTYPSGDDFRKDMLSLGVDVILIRDNNIGTQLFQLIVALVPIFMLLALYKLVIKPASDANNMDADSLIQKSDVKLTDVIGLDEIMGELNIIIRLISDPKSGIDLGARVPHGILLSGPAGVGKTMIAKAISYEADVPFISVNGSDFQELYVGNGARHVRQLFKIAREHSPCIVFIDEFDALGTSRDSVKSNSEDSKTINALLKEMDGFKPLDGVFVIAATNFSDKLDSAITRSGRFDREVIIHPPKDWQVRVQLFETYLKDKPLSDDVDIEHIAKTVGGFTGADIATICNEAALVALSNNKTIVDAACIDEAIDKKVFKGSYSKDKANEPDRSVVAYHEAGHAVMAILLGQKVSRASIRSTTSGVGGAVFHEDTDSQFVTKKEFEDRIKVAYSGRISEDIKFGKITNGASSDIQQATSVIYKYVCVYGMSDGIGLLNLDDLKRLGVYSDEIVIPELKDVSHRLYNEAKDLLNNNYGLVEKLATKLLDIEVMSGEEILDFLGITV